MICPDMSEQGVMFGERLVGESWKGIWLGWEISCVLNRMQAEDSRDRVLAISDYKVSLLHVRSHRYMR